VGLAGPASDLDLVIYSNQPRLAWEGVRQVVGTVEDGDHFRLSRAVRRLRAVASDTVDNLAERNAFNALHRFTGGVVKLDLAYAASTAPVALGGLEATEPGPLEVRAFIVTDASDRYFSPGSVVGTSDRRDYRLWIRDRALRYVLPGDRVVVRGRRADTAAGPAVCALEVLDVQPAR
jgi:hypothetical protein